MKKNGAISIVGEVALTINDFEKGKDAYMLTMHRGRNDGPVITKEEVTRVGRTYVTIRNNNRGRKFQNWKGEYLREKVEYEEASLLVKTKEAAEEYIEKCALARWLGNISVGMAEKYSIEQLRKVKEILDIQTITL